MASENVDPYSDKLRSLEELRFDLEVHMEVQIKINGIEWYIGSDQVGHAIISKNNGDFCYHFKSDEDPDEILDYVIDGKKIRDQWRNIIVVAM